MSYARPLTQIAAARVERIVSALSENSGLSQTQVCERIAGDRNLISYHRKSPSMTTAKHDRVLARASGLWDDAKGEWPFDIPRLAPEAPITK